MKRRTAIAGIATLAAACNSIDKEAGTKSPQPNIPHGLKVLFQGDSITDAGRNKSAKDANNPLGMGHGYTRVVISEFLGKYPEKNIQFYNRGISGHRVFELRDRWGEDCLSIAPDVLSILIGVNDFWHTLGLGYNGTVDTYRNDLNDLLTKTKAALPKVKLILGEPFVLLDGTSIRRDQWIGFFEPYQAVARQAAHDFGAVFIPYQSVFDKAQQSAPTSYWCPDGVHPSLAGDYLMAQAWKETFNKLEF